jgi:FdhD protein
VSTGKQDCWISLPITKYQSGTLRECAAQVVQEVEINVSVNGRYVHTLTCSPWDIEELAVGYLFFKNTIKSRLDIESVQINKAAGVAEVLLATKPEQPGNQKTQACETAEGKTSHKKPHFRDAAGLPFVESTLQVQAGQINSLAVHLEKNSLLFKKTGGVHSALLVKDNEVAAWFEDIGRHSAVDKLAGWCVLNDVDTANSILLFSGRVPYEIITKAIHLRCPIVISPGAPTNLSIELAALHGVTLIGFAKNGEFNVYTHPQRVLIIGRAEE